MLPFPFLTTEHSLRVSSIASSSVFQSPSIPENVLSRGIATDKRPLELSRVRSQTMKEGIARESALRLVYLENYVQSCALAIYADTLDRATYIGIVSPEFSMHLCFFHEGVKKTRKFSSWGESERADRELRNYQTEATRRYIEKEQS